MRNMALLGLLGLFSCGLSNAATPLHSSAAQRLSEGLEKAQQRRADGTGISVNLSPELMNALLGGKARSQNPLGIGTPIRSANQTPKVNNSSSRKDADRTDYFNMDLYGYCSYDFSNGFIPGMYEFVADGYELYWPDNMYEEYGDDQEMVGWLHDGIYYVLQAGYVPGQIYAYYYAEVDFETGDILGYEDLFGMTNCVFLRADLNTDDGRVYGFVHDFSNDEARIFWASADPSDLYDVDLIAPLSDLYDANRGSFCYSLCYNPADGYFYAINPMGELVRIHEDGGQEVVRIVNGEDGTSFTMLTGLVWSPKVNAFVWACHYGATSGMMIIPDGEGACETIDYFPAGPEFTTLVTTDVTPSNPKKPARATIDSINFTDGSMKGNVVFTLPTKLANGNSIPEGTMLDYTVYLDSRRYTSGKAEAGSQITVEYNVEGTGYHIFGITTTYDMAKSFETTKKAWIGNDVPFAPANVTLTQKLITWDAVGSMGIHGGYVNPEDVTYIVYINNEEVGTTKDTSFEVDLDSEDLTAFTAYIYAEFGGERSAAGQSNKVITGNVYTVPMFLTPTKAEFDLMTVIDADGNGDEWYYYERAFPKACVAIDTWAKNDSDDYLFLPPVEITDISHLLSFSLDAVPSDNNYDIEYLEVLWATEPDDDHLGGYIIDEFTPEGIVYYKEFTHKEGLWEVEEPGVYYIALHCTSPANQIGIYAWNFLLEQSPVTVDSPMAPVIKSAKSGAKGALNADITVALPMKNWKGKTLDADMEMTVHMIVNGEPVEATATGRPGENVVVNVPTIQGDNTIQAYVTAGDLQSQTSESFIIFTGQTIPASTSNVYFNVAPDMMTATISWDPVTTSNEPNGYIDPEEVCYTIYIAKSMDMYWTQYRTNVTGNSIDFSVSEFDNMEVYHFGVQAYNDEGVNPAIVRSNEDVMGKPYSLPFSEKLDDETEIFSTEPWLTYNKYDGNFIYGAWVYGELYDIIYGAPFDNSLAIIGYSLWKDDYGLLSMPRFSTKDVDNATITFPTIYGPFMGSLKLLAKKYGYGEDDYIEIGSVDTYSTDISREIVSFQLPEELMDQDWVEIYFLAYFEYANSFTVIETIDVTSDDSGVSLLESAGAVTGGKNVIYVNGFAGQNVTITSLDGKQFVNDVANSDRVAYTLEKGIYIVTAGTQRTKIVVK